MSENMGQGVSDRQVAGDSSGSSCREQSIAPDQILSVLGNEYRRAVLSSLCSAPDGRLEYDVLVARVAGRVRDDKTEEGSNDHRQRTRIAVHHTHLPKLDEAGIVDCDVETGHVEFVGGEFEQELLTLVESYNGDE